jgi:hypothetical protein
VLGGTWFAFCAVLPVHLLLPLRAVDGLIWADHSLFFSAIHNIYLLVFFSRVDRVQLPYLLCLLTFLPLPCSACPTCTATFPVIHMTTGCHSTYVLPLYHGCLLSSACTLLFVYFFCTDGLKIMYLRRGLDKTTIVCITLHYALATCHTDLTITIYYLLLILPALLPIAPC